RLELPPLADRLHRAPRHGDPLARLPPRGPLRRHPRLPGPRPPLRAGEGGGGPAIKALGAPLPSCAREAQGGRPRTRVQKPQKTASEGAGGPSPAVSPCGRSDRRSSFSPRAARARRTPRMTRLLRLVLPVLAAALPLGALAQPA